MEKYITQITILNVLKKNKIISVRGAGAVIHNHSKNAVLATLLYPGDVFKITHLEMIKVFKKLILLAWRQKIAMLIRMQFLNDIIKSRHGS